jgi:hypothetical protein
MIACPHETPRAGLLAHKPSAIRAATRSPHRIAARRALTHHRRAAVKVHVVVAHGSVRWFVAAVECDAAVGGARPWHGLTGHGRGDAWMGRCPTGPVFVGRADRGSAELANTLDCSNVGTMRSGAGLPV